MSQGITRLATVALLALAACNPVQKPNRPLPGSFQALTLTGDVLDRDALSGRPWVISLWRPGCVPCEKQLVQIEKLKARYGPSGLGFLALSTENDEDRVLSVAGRLELQSTIAVTNSEAMGPLSVSQLPATAFLDADAVVVASASGERDDATLERWARRLLEPKLP